jgi:hypothetical protein
MDIDLPEAKLLYKSDFIPTIEQGVVIGGAMGMLAGVVAIALPAAVAVTAGVSCWQAHLQVSVRG